MATTHTHSSQLSRARGLRRAAIVGTVTIAAVLLFAAPALAHITITPDSATAGSAAVLTFHVPNEESSASTIKVDMQIPTDHPIAQLLVKPVPGWTITVKTVTLAKPITTDDGQFNQAVSEVIWSGGQIVPGQFQDFTVSADPLPVDVAQLPFKAIQTYSNGDVVRWIDVAQPGQPEPDHPAPILTLSTAATPVATSTATTTATAAVAAADGTARALGVGGLLVGLIAVLLALMATMRARRLTVTVPGSAGAPAARVAADEQASERELTATKTAGQPKQTSAAAGAAGRRPQGGAGAKATARQGQQRRRG